MKITAKQYARSLFDEVKDLDKSQADKVVGNFAKVLTENNHVSYLPGIIKQFRNIWNKEKGVVEVEVISAHELDKGSASEIEKFIKEKAGGKTVEINYKVEENIKGGFVVKMNDKIFDVSLRSKLRDLRNALAE